MSKQSNKAVYNLPEVISAIILTIIIVSISLVFVSLPFAFLGWLMLSAASIFSDGIIISYFNSLIFGIVTAIILAIIYN